MTEAHAIEVREMSQTGQVRRAASALAERIGFDAEASGRASLVATEAATNLVKHAHGGEILLSAVGESGKGSLEIVAMDRGPGIPDVDRALRDGYSTTGSIGGGLGAIQRNSSRFDLYSGAGGTLLFSRVGGEDRSVVEVGTVQTPHPSEQVCGDAWAIIEKPGRTLVFIADGLGHGEDARTPALLGAHVFARHADEPPAAILHRVHDALKPTRGAAAAVLELDSHDRLARFAGIGNISASVHLNEGSRSMVSHHGVLGHSVRKIQEFVYPWPAGANVIVHSDGIGTHWDLNRYPGLAARRPALIAAALYRDFRRRNDDATVIALREAA